MLRNAVTAATRPSMAARRAIFASASSSSRRRSHPPARYGIASRHFSRRGLASSSPSPFPRATSTAFAPVASKRFVLRALGSEAGGGGAGKKPSEGSKKGGSGGGGGGSEEDMSQEIVLTPGQKVVAGTRLTMWAGVFAFASVCAYYIGKELMPSKMSPNSVFDKAFDVVRRNDEVKRRFGEPLKAYGRDHGGHREGRRNFIEHTEYTSEDDGTKRTRVRFNLEGKFGNAFVFAEVSKDMPSGEFVYILVQDKSNGRVINVVDNRSAIMAKKMAGGSKEGMEALSNLLGGGKK